MNTENVLNMVPVAQAKKWAHAWQNNTDNEYIQKMAKIKSFTFDQEDFQQILSRDRVKKVRAYPAIKTEPGKNPKVTLLVVGVDRHNRDIIRDSPGEMDSGIYDFASPCPNTCGESPLYATPTPR